MGSLDKRLQGQLWIEIPLPFLSCPAEFGKASNVATEGGTNSPPKEMAPLAHDGQTQMQPAAVTVAGKARRGH